MLRRNENQGNGLDPGSWNAEALLDTLISYTVLPEPDCKGPARADEEAVGHFVEPVEGTECQLAHNVMPGHMSPEVFRRKAGSLFEQGVEKQNFWESAGPRGGANFRSGWDALRHVGHGKEVEQRRQLGDRTLPPRLFRFKGLVIST